MSRLYQHAQLTTSILSACYSYCAIKGRQYCALNSSCKITSSMGLREEFIQMTPQG